MISSGQFLESWGGFFDLNFKFQISEKMDSDFGEMFVLLKKFEKKRNDIINTSQKRTHEWHMKRIEDEVKHTEGDEGGRRCKKTNIYNIDMFTVLNFCYK